MINPLLEPKPTDKMRQAHDYARDLAYLVVEESESPNIKFVSGEWKGPHDSSYKTQNPNFRQFRGKWGERATVQNGIHRLFMLLTSFGYTEYSHSDFDSAAGRIPTDTFHLTSKAFELLNQPIAPPSVFISYRRVQSSAFALLIEARLRLAGAERPIIDKNIPYGDEWAKWLETRVKSAEYFVCLVGPKTLGMSGGWVEKEIAWAVEAGSQIISIWHGTHGRNNRLYKLADAGNKCPEVLGKMQAIQVLSEDAKGYEAAVNDLLNSLGYNTY